ncbi:MAG: tetratricopeptide repeat protein [Gammaproteobacteria bacterium]|nr:tetratricopeptide repeat protein [Gammaproteobacteria bacterium]
MKKTNDRRHFQATSLLAQAQALSQTGRPGEALVALNRALEIRPDFAEALNDQGIVLARLMRFTEALARFDRALALKPDFALAHNNRGNTLQCLRRHNEAIASYSRALALNPNYAQAHNNRANSLQELRRYEEAINGYAQALRLKPDYPLVGGAILHTKMQLCSWSDLDKLVQSIGSEISAGRMAAHPFTLLAPPFSPSQQRKCAEIYTRQKFPALAPLSSSTRYSHDKIRIGYYSSDFHNHATAYLIAELFERHDRSRFEVIGFSCQRSPNDAMRQRLTAAFDRLLDVGDQSDHDIALLSRRMEIDIAIDLKGYTTEARTGIFAHRPASIQVSYLGYPGTMGADYIDYLIADGTVIPESHRQYYSEKIACLPHSYQVNDTKRAIAERVFTRKEVGLPENGFVFCCFNNNFKITPDLFDIWMRLLQQVPDSVLWLFEGDAGAAKNLRREAANRKISPERLVFAQRLELPEHLARHQLADLFLDTFYCNAHTTTSDALWAGLPVLTCLGETFAGRVAASLLNAVGLPELVMRSHAEYEKRALHLATHSAELAALKKRLMASRNTCPLFDTQLFTKHIEDAYVQMWQRHQNGLAPDHIRVEPVPEMSD